MSNQYSVINNRADSRSVRLHFSQKQWSELRRFATENRRTMNQEIAIRVIDSLPREGE